MRMQYLSLVAACLLSIAFAMVAGGEEPPQKSTDGVSTVSTTLDVSAQSIRLENGTVKFPGGKTIRIAQAPVSVAANVPPPQSPADTWWMAAAISEDGKLAAVLDLQAKSISLYDAAAKRLREITINRRFGQVHISNKGTIVAAGYVPPNPTENFYRTGAVVYDADGKLVKAFENLPPGPTRVEFLDDGALAAIVLPTPSLEVVWANGESWHRALKPESHEGQLDYVVGTVAVDQARRTLVCTTIEMGSVGTLPSTRIFVYNAVDRQGMSKFYEWTLLGACLGKDTITLSPDGKRLFVVEPRLVRCFDLERNRQQWVQLVGHPDLGTIHTQEGRAIYAADKRVVAVHLSPTGIGWRVVYSVFDVDGKPAHLFATKSDRSRLLNSFLSDQITGARVDGPFWAVSEDGRTLVTLTDPKTKIPLVP